MTDTLATQDAATTCSWPTLYADCGGNCDVYDQWPEDQQDAARAMFEAAAAEYLTNWTGGVFGVCPVAVRPCQKTGTDLSSTYWGRGPLYDPGFPAMGMGPAGGAPWWPVLISGKWYNITCGCGVTCHCEPNGPTSLSLPGPVQSIDEVRIDGVALDPAAYRVEQHRWLIRIDGGVWPATQDMNADAEEDTGTFRVTYQRGIPVPTGGQIAAGRLACELAASACGAECALPDRMQNLTRQGVTVGFDITAEGGTGIWSIDQWVNSVIHAPRHFATVRSVDV